MPGTPEQFEDRQVPSLKDLYNNFGQRFRTLGRVQFGFEDQLPRELTPEETTERGKLEVMADFGLFDSSLTEDQVKAREALYRLHLESEQTVDSANSAQLQDEYQALNRELSDSGLGPEKLLRWRLLNNLNNQGKF